MKNKLLLYICMIILQNNKLGDYSDKLTGICIGVAPWALLTIGLGVEYIEKNIIVTDRYINMLEKRLNNEDHWQYYKDDPTLMIEKKKKLGETIERMRKIKADRKKKKEEKEAQKKQISEEGFAHKNVDYKAMYRFFLLKNKSRPLDYNIVPMQQTLHYMNGNPYSISYQHNSSLKNILEKAYSMYNSHNNNTMKNTTIENISRNNKTKPDTYDYCHWSA